MFLIRPFLSLIENFFIFAVTHLIGISVLLAIVYLNSKTNNIDEILKFITLHNFKFYYLYFVINATLFLTLHNLIFRGIIAPVTIMAAAVIYAAIAKYFNNSYLLFYKDVNEVGVMILFIIYTDIIYMIGLAMFDKLASAVIYRTRSED